MRILIIGGTGTISSAITRQLAQTYHELWLLNRGNRSNEIPRDVKQVIVDINNEAEVLRLLGDTQFRLPAVAGRTRPQAVCRTHSAICLY